MSISHYLNLTSIMRAVDDFVEEVNFSSKNPTSNSGLLPGSDFYVGQAQQLVRRKKDLEKEVRSWDDLAILNHGNHIISPQQFENLKAKMERLRQAVQGIHNYLKYHNQMSVMTSHNSFGSSSSSSDGSTFLFPSSSSLSSSSTCPSLIGRPSSSSSHSRCPQLTRQLSSASLPSSSNRHTSEFPKEFE